MKRVLVGGVVLVAPVGAIPWVGWLRNPHQDALRLDANPLDDIRNTRAIGAVVLEGRVMLSPSGRARPG